MAWERTDVEREVEIAMATNPENPEGAAVSALVKLLQEAYQRIEQLENDKEELRLEYQERMERE